MRILVLSPFGETEPNALQNLSKAARKDVDLELANLSEVYPLDHTGYKYAVLKCANGAVERVIKAEREGIDAVILSCQAEPGLLEARAVVDIPVVGTLEASIHLASMMGRRFSIIATARLGAEIVASKVEEHGMTSRLASCRWIGIPPGELYPGKTPPETVRNRVLEVAERCIEHDGAGVLIPGCTIMGAILSNELTSGDGGLARGDVPIIDPMIAGLKMAEAMADLHLKSGWPIVSRVGLLSKQPEPEYQVLRARLISQRSPEQLYSE